MVSCEPRLITAFDPADPREHTINVARPGALLVAKSVELRVLSADSLAGEASRKAIWHLRELFADGPRAPGSMMAGRAEEGIGAPDVAAASVAALAGDLAVAFENGERA